MTICSESGQVRKEAAIRSLCRASESIERTGFIFARFYQTAQCSTLRATQGDNLSFKRQGMTRRSMPCLFHANLFALDVARWLRQNIGGPFSGRDERLAGPRLRLRDRSTTKYLAAGRATSSKNHP